jgi:hypothetical protein
MIPLSCMIACVIECFFKNKENDENDRNEKSDEKNTYSNSI